MQIEPGDVFGLAKPRIDAHTLGVTTFADLMRRCGFDVVIGDDEISAAVEQPKRLSHATRLQQWITSQRVAVLGVSYRLDVDDAYAIVSSLFYQLEVQRLLADQGGTVKKVCFAGLPDACDRLAARFGDRIAVFYGDETPAEVVARLGLPASLVPADLAQDHGYDRLRMEFGKEIVDRQDYRHYPPADRSGTPDFGRDRERIVDRVDHAAAQRQHPVIRAHAGPYGPKRVEAVAEFVEWARRLAGSGYLDVLSIGTSQLTQEMFGEDWGGRPNGGGVPINSRDEFLRVYNAARPMLVRTYAGTRNLVELARLYDDVLNNAWHALSLWWFSRLDGRGPNPVRDNLAEHLAVLDDLAKRGRTWEANVPHHFAFRGADDLSYVVSAVLAARLAKSKGIDTFIFQNMLNDPKQTWGICDLAKARACRRLLAPLEDADFRILHQTRIGLDFLSHDLQRAKVQMAASSALMDDIAPEDATNPDIIHVVSYSEGRHLADPPIIDESIQITCHALREYRRLKARGERPVADYEPEIRAREDHLVENAKLILETINRRIPAPLTADGLYRILQSGFLPVPHLLHCRDELPLALKWPTRIRFGRVDVYDGELPLDPRERLRRVEADMEVAGS